MWLLRKILYAAVTAVLALMINGCAFQKTVGKHALALKQNVKGDYYLRNEKYQEGITEFNKQILIHPDNAETHYYLGRFQLALDNYDIALNHLKKAVQISPDQADYHFWLGVAYGVKNEAHMERQCYLSALELDKNHVQALTYLGHNYFKQNELREALNIYQKVLERCPENPGALFNRAIILKRYGRKSEEKSAWEAYLSYYPEGPMARLAVGNLNELGYFEYRNYLIGDRTVTLKKISFEPFTSEIFRDSYPSLVVLGEILKNNTSVSIHIVAYQMNNEKLAEGRAKSIKKYLLMNYSKIDPSRLKVSWFGVPEKIRCGNKIFKEEEAINFITATEMVQSERP